MPAAGQLIISTVDEWFTASSAAAVAMRDTDQQLIIQQQAPCQQAGEAWTSEPVLPGNAGFPELGVADFEMGSFDVDSIWSGMDDLWYTQPQFV